jgi:hypothetical protein
MEKQGMKEVLTIGRRLSANFAQMDRVSDLPTTIGCTDAIGTVLPVLLISVELVQFSVSLSSFFVFYFA